MRDMDKNESPLIDFVMIRPYRGRVPNRTYISALSFKA